MQQNITKYCIIRKKVVQYISYMMNLQEFTGGNSDQLDGIENLCRRGDEVIEYIFT